jgi:hypothetical protein
MRDFSLHEIADYRHDAFMTRHVALSSADSAPAPVVSVPPQQGNPMPPKS